MTFQDPVVLLALPLLLMALVIIDRDRPWPTRGLRMLTLVALVVAAAQPAREHDENPVSVVVAVDRSTSMTPERRAAVEVRARELLQGQPVVARIESATGDRTDLRRLLEAAAEAFPDDARTHRILLLSDGADTTNGRTTVDSWKLAGAQIYALSPPAPEADVALTQVTAPSTVDGRSWDLALEAWATKPVTTHVNVQATAGPGTPTLDTSGVDLTWELTAGPNLRTWNLPAPSPGRTRVDIQLDTAGDPWPEDEKATVWLERQTDEPALIVGPGADRVAALLRAQDHHARATLFPETLPAGGTLWLIAPDVEQWPQGRAEQLRTWVRDEGGKLLVVGGPKGLNAREPKLQPLDRLLPVKLPDKPEPRPAPAGVVFVVDRSDSMVRLDKLALALGAIRSAVESLPPDAIAGVLAFSDDDAWAVPLAPVGPPGDRFSGLDALTAQGGTDMYPAVADAGRALVDIHATVRHVVVLSDGQGLSRLPQHRTTLEALIRQGITISTVALSDDAAQAELAQLAELGGGRAYVVRTAQDLPKLLLEETALVLPPDKATSDRAVLPVPNSPLALGLEPGELPPIAGFVPAEARSGATLGWVHGPEAKPLLASWRYGRGTATVLLTELGDTWGARWMAWPKLAPTLGRLQDAVEHTAPPPPLRLQTLATSAGLRVEAFADTPLGAPRPGRATATIEDAHGSHEVVFEDAGPGRAVALVPWDGALDVKVTWDGADNLPASSAEVGSQAMGSPELSVPRSSATTLDTITRSSGGKVDPTAEELMHAGVQAQQVVQPLDVPLALLGLASFLLDVLLRRWIGRRTLHSTGSETTRFRPFFLAS